MQRLRKFPSEWKNIFHCTRHFDYSQRQNVDVDHITSPFVKHSEWDASLIYNEKRFGISKPKYIFQTPFDSVLCLFEGSDHWFLFEGDVSGDCSTCDGDTNSWYTVKEFLCLHDFFYNGLNDFERSELTRPYWLSSVMDGDEQIFRASDYDTYQDFRREVSRNKIKKILFFLDGGVDE
ncbi:hypothetical protein LAU_0294 [Lausannevirus]|uniref:DUF5869 domain-containing protein n=1 Tax=Lausannevirus TaxID=999883 RepID=F2WLM2_9VIRU|nr:hypothetical protein LAU_0294 [Lausannevirus]AEA07145.1 hypothetical protein LAU_0294 [Lausannevirus]